MLTKEKQKFYERMKKLSLKFYWSNKDTTQKNIYRPNGFSKLPKRIYSIFSKQINKDGRVLDLGCGNGLMLKYLMENSGYKLIPFGIDFMKKSIEQAKKLIHPQYSRNFIYGNFIDYDHFFKKIKFDFIFVPIFALYKGDRIPFIKKLQRSCKKRGRIIFYGFPDELKKYKYSSIEQIPELRELNLIIENSPNVSIAIWKREI